MKNSLCVLLSSVLIGGALSVIATVPACAQSDPLQERIFALKESMAANKQRLMQYAWTETTQLTMKGDQKAPGQDRCQYGPNGKVVRTPLGIPPVPPSAGPIKKRMIEKKKGELQEYIENAKSLLHMYLPPDDLESMEKARAAGNIQVSQGDGMVNIVIANYVFPGDRMTLKFDPRAKKLTDIGVETYMDEPKNAVTLQVRMASLADGTSYIQQMVLNCPAKKLVVTTTNSDYQKVNGLEGQ